MTPPNGALRLRRVFRHNQFEADIWLCSSNVIIWRDELQSARNALFRSCHRFQINWRLFLKEQKSGFRHGDANQPERH